MGDDNDDEFAVGPDDEMKQRFGWTAENWRPPILQAAVVPEGLRDLVPLAQRWGVTCDVTRHDVAAKARDAELAELSEGLRGRYDGVLSPRASLDAGA